MASTLEARVNPTAKVGAHTGESQYLCLSHVSYMTARMEANVCKTHSLAALPPVSPPCKQNKMGDPLRYLTHCVWGPTVDCTTNSHQWVANLGTLMLHEPANI